MRITATKNTALERFFLAYGLYAAMGCIIITFACLNSNFLTFTNVLNIFEQAAYYMVCAMGMTFVLISKEVDLSVGGVLAALTVLGGFIMKNTGNVSTAILIMLGMAVVLGLFNGFCVVILKLPSFIATIATGYIVRGFAGYYTDGAAVSGFPNAFTKFAWQKVLGVPVLLVIALIMLAITVYILNFTAFGRTVFACGANKKATKLMGIHANIVCIAVFVISAICTCVGAIMVMSRSGVARFSTLPNLQMQCIAAAVIGGTSLTGGKGNLVGTAVGVLLFSLVQSGLNAMGVLSFWQEIFTGAIIILATVLDSAKTRSNAA